MEMIVRTKADFEKALKEMPEKIVFEGELADKIKKAVSTKKIGKKVAIAGIAVAIGGVLAAPFTGGLSLGATAASISGMTLTAGTMTLVLTAVELVVVAGVAVAALGVTFSVANNLLKNYDNMEVGPFGVRFSRKKA